MPIKTAALFLLVLVSTGWPQDPAAVLEEPDANGAPRLLVPPLAMRRVVRMGFTRDGKALFTQDQQQIVLWDVERGLVLRGLSGLENLLFFGAAMNPARDALWYSNPVTLTAEKRDLNGLTLQTLSRVSVGRPILALAGAIDSMLLYRDRHIGKVFLTPVADRADLRELPSTAGYWSAAALSPHGRTAAIGNYDGHLVVYDYADRRTVFDIPNPDSAITQVEFSADGKLVAALLQPSGCIRPDDNTGEYRFQPRGDNCPMTSSVLVWDTETGKPFYSASLDRVFSIALAENGQNIAIGLLNQVRIVNLLRKVTVRTLPLELDQSEVEPGEFRSVQVALSPDGRYLAESAFGPIRIFDLTNGRLVRSLADPPQTFASNSMLTSTGRLLMAQSHPTRIVVTELSPGVSTRILKSPAQPRNRPLISADGSTLASRMSDGSLRVWGIASQELRCRAPWTAPGIDTFEEMALSADGSLAVIPVRERDDGEQGVEVWDVRACKSLGTIEHTSEPPPVAFVFVPAGAERRLRHVGRIAISPSGRYVSWATSGNDLHVWDTVEKRFTFTTRVPVLAVFSVRDAANRISNRLRKDGQPAPLPANLTELDALLRYDQIPDGISGLNFGSRDSELATLDVNGLVRVWSPDTGKQRFVLGAIPGEGTAFILNNRFQRPYGFAEFAFSPDGRLGMAVLAKRNNPVLWDLNTGKALRSFKGFSSFGCCGEFSPDGKRVLFGGGGSHTLISDVDTGEPLARIGTYGDGSDWLVWRDDGLFDGSAAAYREPGWVFNPMSPQRSVLPMEAFFADFFRPGLLPDVLAGKTIAAARDLSKVDRRQARIEVQAANANAGAPVSAASVMLRIRGTLPPADERRPAAGAIKDLRLFRNGSLVHSWRQELKPGPDGVVEVTTPAAVTEGPNEFVAYGFNQDNVQSNSGVLYLSGAPSLARQPNAHLIVIGINEYDNPEFRLKYAAPDARLVAADFADSLRKTRQYAKVNVTAILDAEATRDNLLSLLAQLGGGTGRPGARRIAAANPQDAVFIFFAGHGWARDGRFYLIPRDLGYAGSRTGLAQYQAAQELVLKHAISDLELGSLLEPISAREVVLIVDACNAGQLLESQEARQGPFNSKGLAQLAWEKGMYILTAAQSYQAALESSQFGHGYLTQALFEEGLKQRKADRDPYDGQIEIKEWFDFASLRVPELQRERQGQGRLLIQAGAGGAGELQIPRAFYRADRRARLIVSGPTDATALGCAQEASLKSGPRSTPSTIQWENATSSIRKLYWIDFNGNRSARGILAPGARLSIGSFIGHLWLVADEAERCVEIYTPESPKETATIDK